MREITNEILLEKMKNLAAINEFQHQEIIKQTTKTNGSVASMMQEIDRLKSWQNKWIGISMVISAILIPIILYLLYKHINW